MTTIIPQLSTLSIILAVCHLQAATVTWTSTDINGGSGVGDLAVSTSGTLIEAANFGGAGVPSPVINGVTFTGIDFTGVGSASNFTANYNNSFSGAGITGAGNIDTLLDTLATNNPTVSANFFNATGLSVDRDYQIQFFINHEPTSDRTHRIIGGGGSIDITNGDQTGTPAAQVATGTFTADAATQAFEFRSIIGGAFGGFQYMNGYQLRDITVVPEPSSVFLMGLSSLMLIFKRSRH